MDLSLPCTLDSKVTPLAEDILSYKVSVLQVISNLCKAAGLPTMFASIRPDIDHVDEYVRNCTARTLSVMAQAMGIPMVIKFIKAVCASKKSWQARHTGIKSVQQIAILMGCAVLPHMTDLVATIANGLLDDNQKVKTITALALAALAEAGAPYGIESFDQVQHGLAAFMCNCSHITETVRLFSLAKDGMRSSMCLRYDSVAEHRPCSQLLTAHAGFSIEVNQSVSRFSDQSSMLFCAFLLQP